MIGFESRDTSLRKLREELQRMTDAELIAFDKHARSMAGTRISGTGDPHKIKLGAESGAEALGTYSFPDRRMLADCPSRGLSTKAYLRGLGQRTHRGSQVRFYSKLNRAWVIFFDGSG